MLQVTRYEHPLILVTRRQTGESYRFVIGPNGALIGDAGFECAEARSAALKYLAKQTHTPEAA